MENCKVCNADIYEGHVMYEGDFHLCDDCFDTLYDEKLATIMYDKGMQYWTTFEEDEEEEEEEDDIHTELFKEKIKAVFAEIYPGRRLLAVHLNGFTHSIITDGGKSNSPILSRSWSAYVSSGDDEREKEFFKRIGFGYHHGFKHNAIEILFVKKEER